jgi:hypothetical protein
MRYAVWGRCPTACAVYVFFKRTWSVLGLFDKISPAFVRVEKLGCATRSWTCLATALTGVFVGLVALGLFVHPLRTEFVPRTVSLSPREWRAGRPRFCATPSVPRSVPISNVVGDPWSPQIEDLALQARLSPPLALPHSRCLYLPTPGRCIYSAGAV